MSIHIESCAIDVANRNDTTLQEGGWASFRASVVNGEYNAQITVSWSIKGVRIGTVTNYVHETMTGEFTLSAVHWDDLVDRFGYGVFEVNVEITDIEAGSRRDFY